MTIGFGFLQYSNPTLIPIFFEDRSAGVTNLMLLLKTEYWPLISPLDYRRR